jgi:hypothetical protein
MLGCREEEERERRLQWWSWDGAKVARFLGADLLSRIPMVSCGWRLLSFGADLSGNVRVVD